LSEWCETVGSGWVDIKKEHVIEAIKKYECGGMKAYSKNTFLIHNEKLYPAKHIRALAYAIAFGVPADKSTFSARLVKLYQYLSH
jgi:hypothetical protein